MDVTIPPPVEPGMKVAIVSPSFGAIAAWPHRAERAVAYLETLGLRPEVMPNAALEGPDPPWVSAPPEARAADLHRAFADDEVGVVLCGIGGNHSNQVLPHLDFDLIGSHPKVFQGYSDITVLHWALLRRAGLATFYGPALVSELGEFPAPLAYTDRYLRAAWFRASPLRYEPAGEWTEEFLDWDLKADTRPRKMQASPGWKTVRPGTAEGPVVGGCLETVCWHVFGSRDWFVPEGTILLLETSEEAPSPAHVDAYLTDLELAGAFDACTGLLFGRPMGYSPDDVEVLWRVVEQRTEGAGIPVLAGIDCGHTDPMMTVPLGAHARLDAAAQTFEVLLD
ncbi:MAG TPA: S66 peptidase family protein [Actinomycetota bacterium]|nr:S66 peptidase family protein [Actinomycetota bacterium]